VQQAVDTFETLLQFDRLFVGGGNAKKLTVDLGHRVGLRLRLGRPVLRNRVLGRRVGKL
jgi:hypothetical protein